ncbi:GSCOCG00008354001-RA-CDS [Cotesia congregata]|uniref:Similar to Ssna1: Sjoegren syndrome nuclear autoantigen 1 homolog (Mus musculus) n=1 Tax=Cotesia congregata TaxID=51543 RepID=A0A8J2HNL1_COTCN|nr:GSCOCG00008354001-RA-CDS [Cotesia congregata]CAG5107595.1 Similar to Ssna1: Sjoegren syndrome nuclear autoantigen 1 homolog (Mus musculus) [Cotesia congregata]
MSQHGAALQTYNQELVKCLEDVKSKKAMIQAEIDVEEEEQHNLEREIKKLHYKLAQVTDSLNKKILIRNEYNRIITDTEAHYMKIVDSSQMLLAVVQRETSSLDQSLGKSKPEKSQSHPTWLTVHHP